MLQALSAQYEQEPEQSSFWPGWTWAKAKAQRKQCPLTIECWNMWTLVESEGPIDTSVARPGGRGVAVEHKAESISLTWLGSARQRSLDSPSMMLRASLLYTLVNICQTRHHYTGARVWTLHSFGSFLVRKPNGRQ